jgi:hypothetical protein
LRSPYPMKAINIWDTRFGLILDDLSSVAGG